MLLPRSAPPSVPATIATSRPVPAPIRLPMPRPPNPPMMAPRPRCWLVWSWVSVICSITPWRISVSPGCCAATCPAVRTKTNRVARQCARRYLMMWLSLAKASGLFRKHELHLCANLPVRPEFRAYQVVVTGNLRIHRQLAEMEDLADAAADRHRPPVAAVRFPVRGHDRRGREVQAFVLLEVIVQERLKREIVVRATGAVGYRPDVVHQEAVDPRIALLQMQDDERRPETPAVGAELRIRCGGNLDDGTCAPDQAALRIGGRQERGEHGRADAVEARVAREERRLRDDRDDGARDDVPFLRNLDRHDRLDVEDVLGLLERPEVEVGVVLERQADEIADRILGELRQLLGAHLGVGAHREKHRRAEQRGGEPFDPVSSVRHRSRAKTIGRLADRPIAIDYLSGSAAAIESVGEI